MFWLRKKINHALTGGLCHAEIDTELILFNHIQELIITGKAIPIMME